MVHPGAVRRELLLRRRRERGRELSTARRQGLDHRKKDGILLCLLAAEITAVTGKDPGEHYQEITARLGAPVYTRINPPCTPPEKAGFKRLTAEAITAASLAGDAIELKLTKAPGNGAAAEAKEILKGVLG